MPVIQEYSATETDLVIKFEPTLKVSSIVNSCFELLRDSATPVSSPFVAIDLTKDYRSVSRTIKLYFAETLLPNTTYVVNVSGLENVAGTLLPDDSFEFTTDSSVTPVTPPTAPPVEVIDYSIKTDAVLTSETTVSGDITAANPDFYIVSTDPENFDYLLEEDYNSGKISIEFSARPDLGFLNTRYFKAQRKKIQRGPSRWENIDVEISIDADKPIIYIAFPSDDATPVYVTSDKVYFETGYKYRIRISKDIGA